MAMPSEASMSNSEAMQDNILARPVGAAKRVRTPSIINLSVVFEPPSKQQQHAPTPLSDLAHKSHPRFNRNSSCSSSTGSLDGCFPHFKIPTNDSLSSTISALTDIADLASPTHQVGNTLNESLSGMSLNHRKFSGLSWGSSSMEFEGLTPTNTSSQTKRQQKSSCWSAPLPRHMHQLPRPPAELAAPAVHEKPNAQLQEHTHRLQHQQHTQQTPLQKRQEADSSSANSQEEILRKFMFDPKFQTLPEQAKKIVLEKIKAQQAADNLLSMTARSSCRRPSSHKESDVDRRAPKVQALMATCLPQGWSRHLDRSRGRIYYHNRLTRTTTWTHPAGVFESLGHQQDTSTFQVDLQSPRSKQRCQ